MKRLRIRQKPLNPSSLFVKSALDFSILAQTPRFLNLILNFIVPPENREFLPFPGDDAKIKRRKLRPGAVIF
jgi:hypothetical protein